MGFFTWKIKRKWKSTKWAFKWIFLLILWPIGLIYLVVKIIKFIKEKGFK